MSESIYLFYVLLFVVAFLYASVGHGGASGYLALMAIFNFAPAVMKPTALLLNLFVSAVSFLQFYRGGHFKWKMFLPLVVLSIPLAYLGGLLSIDSHIYKKVLGLILIIPIVRFLFFPNIKVEEIKPYNIPLCIVIGGVIGFLSGLIGIGGGIILSPILLLLKWSDQKQTAAISAAFIFVNSLSGLFGQMKKGLHFSTDMYAYVAIAFIAGICGAYFGSIKFKQTILKNTLALVLMLAAYKLLFTNA
ncbi:MAG: sulfite exporter TauE/SafE family protein [Chitinophagaceae bacterium]